MRLKVARCSELSIDSLDLIDWEGALSLVEPVRHALVNQFPANSSKAYGFKALAALKGVTLQFRQCYITDVLI